MKSDVRKRSMSVALVVTVILALVVPVAADAQTIPQGPSTVLPDYIGAPAKAHPTANSAPQKDPFMAPHPFSWSHSDSWKSDTANIAGPLGRNPEVLSSTLEDARQYRDDWLISCENCAFDSHGRPIVSCAGLREASVIMLDPDTLEVLTSYPLVIREGLAGEGKQQIPLSMWSIYDYLDNRDQINIVSGNK